MEMDRQTPTDRAASLVGFVPSPSRTFLYVLPSKQASKQASIRRIRVALSAIRANVVSEHTHSDEILLGTKPDHACSQHVTRSCIINISRLKRQAAASGSLLVSSDNKGTQNRLANGPFLGCIPTAPPEQIWIDRYLERSRCSASVLHDQRRKSDRSGRRHPTSSRNRQSADTDTPHHTGTGSTRGARGIQFPHYNTETSQPAQPRH